MSILLHTLAFAEHQRDIAHCRQIFVFNFPPNLVGSGILARVIGFETTIEFAGMISNRVGQNPADRERPKDEHKPKNLSHCSPVLRARTLQQFSGGCMVPAGIAQPLWHELDTKNESN